MLIIPDSHTDFVPMSGCRVVEYGRLPVLNFDGSPVPERCLDVLRRLVGYGRASTVDQLKQSLDEADRQEAARCAGRSQGFDAMTEALWELVQRLELGSPGTVPLRHLADRRESEPG